VASVVKSGGKTRRAAKMNTLKDWHPDIEEFIEAKMKEEKKAWALIEQGYDGSFNGEAYGSVMYQNENLTVRVSDEFMEAALAGREWTTVRVTDGKPCEKKDARTMLRKIAEGTHVCGDPGMQFESTIHKWHTCKGTARQNSTNPCSEYLFLDNTACNLASLNLMKFKSEDGTFDVEKFKAAVRIYITAQEIVVDNASYPTKFIAENSHIFRTLGLGYANLGALIMSYGHGYDSPEGRALAGSITSIMTGHAYEQSARIAGITGPFPGYHDSSASGV
jgi:ribonucleoside-diphosphate reductase alpha chain